MPRHSVGKLPDLDLSQPVRVTYNLRPETRAYLASVAAANSLNETEVLHLALGLLRGLGQIGVHDHVSVPAMEEGQPTSRILLGLDPTTAAFSVQQYQEMHATQQAI